RCRRALALLRAARRSRTMRAARARGNRRPRGCRHRGGAEVSAESSAQSTAIADFDLTTTYLGLTLRSPLVASSGPLTARVDSLRSLEQAGIAAVVLPSLFEEQVEYEDMEADRLSDFSTDSNPEASSCFPDMGEYESVADRYLRHLEEAKKALSIPVIASLNGVTPGG